MSRWPKLTVAGAMVIGFLVAAGPAQSAVRLCYPAVSSGLQEAQTEQAARALAISAWITAASAHGPAFTTWRLAASKFYKCTQTAGGTHQCLAQAEPCGILQVPPPPDGLWQPRKPPGVSG